MRSQVEDYALRGDELVHLSFFNFLVDTYEEAITSKDKQLLQQHETQQQNIRGRPRNQRSHYFPSHPKSQSHRRVIRSTGHNTMPDIIGPFFPNAKGDRQELYFASMLALLRPWRELNDIKSSDQTFQTAYFTFRVTASEADLNIISGIQYHYDCKNASTDRNPNGSQMLLEEADEVERLKDNAVDTDIADEHGDEDMRIDLTETDLQAFQEAQKNVREERHGALAVYVAESRSILSNNEEHWVASHCDGVSIAQGDDYHKILTWQSSMNKVVAQINEDVDDERDNPLAAEDEGQVTSDTLMVETVAEENNDFAEGGVQMLEDTTLVQENLNPLDVSGLLKEQRRVYDIVDKHLNETLGESSMLISKLIKHTN